MASSDNAFRVFCHIDNYGSSGFSELHRMIATSKPLVLWAPSSVRLLDKSCQVSGPEFVSYVERGLVRVYGREDWILSPRFRSEHPWDGAPWNESVDGPLKSMALNDARLPADQRRVVLAPQEQGSAWATRFVEAHPEVVTALDEQVRSADSLSTFSPGVLQAIFLRSKGDPRLVAREVLSHAYNHGEAISFSQSVAPFFLEPRDSGFVQLLKDIRQQEMFDLATINSTTHTAEEFADLTKEVLAMLAVLDGVRRSKLSRFVGGDGHETLVRWTADLSKSMAETGASRTEGVALKTLQRQFDEGRLEDSAKEIFLSRAGVEMVAGGVLSAATLDPTSVLSALGLVVASAGLVEAGLKRVGVIPAPYRGVSWPFLYVFGGRATRRRKARIEQVLDNRTPP